jgi:hypothetical protein
MRVDYCVLVGFGTELEIASFVQPEAVCAAGAAVLLAHEGGPASVSPECPASARDAPQPQVPLVASPRFEPARTRAQVGE